nr:unnamed protein product [Digitaria exilis]
MHSNRTLLYGGPYFSSAPSPTGEQGFIFRTGCSNRRPPPLGLTGYPDRFGAGIGQTGPVPNGLVNRTVFISLAWMVKSSHVGPAMLPSRRRADHNEQIPSWAKRARRETDTMRRDATGETGDASGWLTTRPHAYSATRAIKPTQVRRRISPIRPKTLTAARGAMPAAASSSSAAVDDPHLVRNTCILAHVDHGKTSLADHLVASGGGGLLHPKLAGSARFMDHLPEEQRRAITMKSSSVALRYAHPSTGGPHHYRVHLIDSPGHADFCSEVSAAARLSDSALVVVDAAKGVRVQTHAALRQAFVERLRPCLVLNKLDRLITDLLLSPDDAYARLRRILAEVNSFCSALRSGSYFSSLLHDDDGRRDGDDEDEDAFHPHKGNVVFACARDGWGFRIDRFADLYAKKTGASKANLLRGFWGPYYVDKEKKAVLPLRKESTGSAGAEQQPAFVQNVLKPLWKVYQRGLTPNSGEWMQRNVVSVFDLKVSPRELHSKDPKVSLHAVLRAWLPLADSVMEMLVECTPDPVAAQAFRVPRLMPERRVVADSDSGCASIVAEAERVRSCVAACSTSTTAPVVVFVSKMFVVPYTMLPSKGLNGELLNHNHQAQHSEQEPEESFLAFARVFSGVLRAGQKVFVLSPLYDPVKGDAAASGNKHAQEVELQCLYQMLGQDLMPIDSVAAGNVVAIQGLGQHVLKSATLSSTKNCWPFSSMTFQVSPMLKVAVEPSKPTDLGALVKGLKLLNQADPLVVYTVSQRGEHVLAAAGQVHLERCIKDLQDRFAKVQLETTRSAATAKLALPPPPSSNAAFPPLQTTPPLRLSYKLRLCIEGLPLHARQPETLKQLFHPDTLIECIDEPTSDKDNPDGFALEGDLNLYESVERDGHCPSLATRSFSISTTLPRPSCKLQLVARNSRRPLLAPAPLQQEPGLPPTTDGPANTTNIASATPTGLRPSPTNEPWVRPKIHHPATTPLQACCQIGRPAHSSRRPRLLSPFESAVGEMQATSRRMKRLKVTVSSGDDKCHHRHGREAGADPLPLIDAATGAARQRAPLHFPSPALPRQHDDDAAAPGYLPTSGPACSNTRNDASVSVSASPTWPTSPAPRVKLQWLGLDGEQVHHKAEKKKMKQCLDMYTGSAKQTAESALHDLLLNGAGVNSHQRVDELKQQAALAERVVLQLDQIQDQRQLTDEELSLRRFHRSDEQAIVDRVAARLLAWKRRLLNKAGRLTLVQAVLLAIPTYYMTDRKRQEEAIAWSVGVVFSGQGNWRATFWHDRWLQGKSPKEIAPDLYKLAWRKNETVATGLTNGRWKRGLRRLSTMDEVNQYVDLWALVHEVQLIDQLDGIAWNQTEQAVIYIVWNIWKKRCRRVFDNKELSVPQLVLLIKQDIHNWHTAHGFWEELQGSTQGRPIPFAANFKAVVFTPSSFSFPFLPLHTFSPVPSATRVLSFPSGAEAEPATGERRRLSRSSPATSIRQVYLPLPSLLFPSFCRK